MKLGWTLLTTVSLGSSLAAADSAEYARATPAALTVDGGSSARGVSEGWLILPQGLELGSELALITAQPSLGGEQIAFTDVALMRLHARRSLAERAELYAAVSIL